MELEGRTPSIDGFSQEILKKEDVRVQTQSQYNLNTNHRYNNVFNNARKIFVGRLPSKLTTEEFKVFFEQFGSVEDVVVMTNKETNRPRGFGFVTFGSQETANNVIKKQYYDLKNKRVEVKKAVSKDRMGRNFGNYYHTFANFSGYFNGMNVYRYGACSCLGYDGLSYVYYPYPNPNPNYTNSWPYQSLYDYAATYSYPSPYNYGNIPHISKNSEKYRNTTPVVMKKNSEVKDCDDSDVAVKEKGEKGCDHLRQRESNDEESAVKSVLENCDGDHGEICDGLSLHSDGSSRQMGADR